MLNYGVEWVVKGLAFALLCFALLWGWGLASFVVAAVFCLLFCSSARGGVSEQINQSGAVAVSARTIAKIIIFGFSTDLCCARQQMQCDFHAIEFIHFGGLLLYKNAAGRSGEKSDRRDS